MGDLRLLECTDGIWCIYYSPEVSAMVLCCGDVEGNRRKEMDSRHTQGRSHSCSHPRESTASKITPGLWLPSRGGWEYPVPSPCWRYQLVILFFVHFSQSYLMTKYDGIAGSLGCREQRIDLLDAFCDFLNFFPEVSQMSDISVDKDDTTFLCVSSACFAPKTSTY